MALMTAFSLVSCGGGSTGSNPAISISPTSASLFCSQTQQFTATVTGIQNAGIRWTVNGVLGGAATTGWIDHTGLYTAPCAGFNDGTQVTVTATISQAPSATASATVTLQALVLSVTPKDPTLAPGQSLQFNVTANKPSYPTTVTWLVEGVTGGNPTVGTISPTGLYTAPATPPSSNPVTVEADSTVVSIVKCQTSVTIAGGVPLSGTAAKGTLSGATVNVFAVNPADGSNGSTLGTATTSSTGAFSLTIPQTSGPVRITVSGGTYTSPFDGATVTNQSGISAVLDSVVSATSGVAVTPLSDLVNSLMLPSLNATSVFSTVHAAANTQVAALYGLSGGAQTESLLPAFTKTDITSNPDGFKAGLVIGGLEAEAQAICPAASRDLIFGALTSDIQDGRFDGMLFTSAVPFACSTSNQLPSTAGTTDFLLALNTYIQSGSAMASNGITAADVSGLLASLSTGMVTSSVTPPSAGLTTTHSGGIAALSFGGHQYVFIAARTEGVVVLDVTDPANPTAKAWTYLYTNTFTLSSATAVISYPVRGAIPVVGLASHPQILLFAYGTKHIALVNAQVLATGTPGTDDSLLVDFQADLPLAATTPVQFSSGSAYVAGGIPDIGHKGVWLATADGYDFFDLATNALGTASFPVDATQYLAETVGGDIAHQLIFGANYQGIQLLDLAANLSYDMTSTSYDSSFTDDFGAPIVGFSVGPDQGTVDSRLQVGIVTFEDNLSQSNVGFLNLATISKNAGTPNTFTAATGGTAMARLSSLGFGQPVISGSAVDSSTHQALFMSGFSNDMAVGQLQDPSAVPSGSVWAGLTDWSFYTLTNSPTLANYCFATNPHAVDVVFNLSAGKSFGYLLDGCTNRALQIDLSGFLAQSRLGSTGDAAHQPASDPIVAGTIKAITW